MRNGSPPSSLPLLAHALPTLAPRDEQILLARLAVERAAQEAGTRHPRPIPPACPCWAARPRPHAPPATR